MISSVHAVLLIAYRLKNAERMNCGSEACAVENMAVDCAFTILTFSLCCNNWAISVYMHRLRNVTENFLSSRVRFAKLCWLF
jgi:hypothetical protein